MTPLSVRYRRGHLRQQSHPEQIRLSIAGRSRASVAVIESREAGIYSAVAELLLDAEQLVVLGDTLGPGRGTGLDLAGVQGNCEISDGGVFGLTGTVGCNSGHAGLVSHLDGLEGLGNGTDLVELDKNGVACAELDTLFQSLSVGDKEIVAYQLDLKP